MVSILFLFSSCWKKNIQTFNFDRFILSFSTYEHWFIESDSFLTRHTTKYRWLKKIYIYTWNSGYNETLFLLNDISLKGRKTLTWYVEMNKKFLKRSVPNINIDEKNISFLCKNKNIPWVLLSWSEESNIESLKDNNLIYFSHFYFISDNIYYLLSLSTRNENVKKNFESSLNNIKCQF